MADHHTITGGRLSQNKPEPGDFIFIIIVMAVTVLAIIKITNFLLK